VSKAPRSLPPQEMVRQMSAAFLRLGFERVHRSETGSCYLRYVGTPFEVRLSDHRWSGFNKERYPQVVRSIALKPVPAHELWPLALELAIGFLVKMEARKDPRASPLIAPGEPTFWVFRV
jgi:hypothetical protein